MKNMRFLAAAVFICLPAVIFYSSTGFALDMPAAEYFPSGWSLNRGYPHKIEREFRTLSDGEKAYNGDKYAFVRGHLMSSQVSVSGGDEFEISFYARDPGGKEVSCMLYTYGRVDGKKRYLGSLAGFTAQAGREWTEVSGRIKIPPENGDSDRMMEKKNPVESVIVVLASETGACFDYPSISHIKAGIWINPECGRREAAGRLKMSRQDYGGALEEFKTALNLVVTEEERGRVLSQIEEAVAGEKILMTRDKTGNLLASADSYAGDKKYGEAVKKYMEIKKLSSAGKDYIGELALFNIARLYRLDGNFAGAHETYSEIFSLPGLSAYYRIYGLFRQAEAYVEEKEHKKARDLYGMIIKAEEALDSHVFKARLYAGDTYRLAGDYRRARNIYKTLLLEQESSGFPHESYRRDIIDRLENIDGLADGATEKRRDEKFRERLKSPGHTIYVALNGRDGNPGTRELPFATIGRAQEEARKIKERGMPEGGIAVYLRGGRYFIEDGLSFVKEDSGTAGAPVVYRGYPGEKVRIIGGRDITSLFKPLDDPGVLKRLPEEAKDRVWAADLKKAGITDYGQLLNRGMGSSNPAALELFYNTLPMNLARWPKEGWDRVNGLVAREGDEENPTFEKGRFTYAGNRPKLWVEDRENIWITGYFSRPWHRTHTRVAGIDAENRIVNLTPDTRYPKSHGHHDVPVIVDAPYYFYNVLSELSAPGEFYMDRETGILYFYPPGEIDGSEIIISTLEAPVLSAEKASHMVFFGLTLECTRHEGMKITGGSDNLIAGCIIRNTGTAGVIIDGGWNNSIFGCDMHDLGAGGISLSGGDWEKLIPAGHYVANNHIYRFNRFDGGYRPAVSMGGTGQRVSHNVISDSPHQALTFSFNEHLIEFNEFYDVVHEARDAGAIYTYGEPRFLMNRGNVMRYNFFHHISERGSPLKTHLVAGLYIDALNGGMTVEGNIFFRCTERALYAHGPDNRIENNLFIKNNAGISFADRSWLLDASRLKTLIPRNEKLCRRVRYKQPSWSYRYPQLTGVFEDNLPLGRTEKNVVGRNINTGGLFISSAGIRKEKNLLRNNWNMGEPFFVNAEERNFRLREGAPVFGIKGIQPVPFEKIGVYEDPLRASWPVKRLAAGKYSGGSMADTGREE